MRIAVATRLALAAMLVLPAAAAASSAVDASPLAANGLQSPSCTTPALTQALAAAQRTNCEVSGIAVAPVPLSDYAVDVNIPSGLGASGGQDIATIVQDLFVTPLWTAVVWLVHVVLIALEWCYSIDLLGPATLAKAGSALGGAQRVFTSPWLGLTLAVAAVGFAWQGLVRRRVLDTLGHAALLALMVSGGLWIIADPPGTVGAIGNMADRAALATVAASATGNPATPVASVDAAFADVFETATAGPWCYLEFGDVNWCRDPAELDPRLRAVAVRLEQQFRVAATCRGHSPVLVQCAPGGSALQRQEAGAATALAEARSNGGLFLALPPDAIERDALPGQTVLPTLYGTLCGSSDPTACTAPTAPQAEFRTASGTWPRVGGLLLIVAGTLGMLLLLGFLALRLLGAALATLLYLMLAPLAVLAPGFGEPGRAAFRLWFARLLGATVAKLVYSVALGVVLLIVKLLTSLNELGWWTQWLLVSAFWWMAFEQRHRLLSLVLHERGEPQRRAPLATRVWLGARTAGGGAATIRASGRAGVGLGRRGAATVTRVREFPQERAAPAVRGDAGRRGPAAREHRGAARANLAAQVRRVAAVDGRPAEFARVAVGQRSVLQARRARIEQAATLARARGDRRREVSLRLRAHRVDAQLRALRTPPPRRIIDQALMRVRGDVRARQRTISRTLDRAARAPAGRVLAAGDAAAPLAGLAGLSREEYLRRPPSQQRAARAEIERELARRRGWRAEVSLTQRVTRAVAARDGAAVPVPITRRARQFGGRLR